MVSSSQGRVKSMGSILVAHESKVIRAALTRYLADSHSVLEALDGESAWHALVLNHDIIALIAGPDLARLDGMALLSRLRHNKLERLKRIPFYFIGSEIRIAALTEAAKKEGVTDFILNDMGKQEVLSILKRQGEAADPLFEEALSDQKASVAVEKSRDKAPTPAAARGKPQAIGGKAGRKAGVAVRKSVALLSASLFADGMRRMCSHHGGQSAVMIFALDGYSALAASLGAHVASSIIEKLAKPVQANISASDVIGHYQPGCFALATMNSGLEACVAFARRVATGLANAHIVVQGKPVHVSISVGIASRPEDGDVDGDTLLNLAKARLDSAIAAGGGRIQTHGGK
jgi:diguanylate cyclase (GGDEF)-like protein